MMPFDPKPDHGTFKILPPNEDDLIQQGITRARGNAVRPGHFWWRITVEDDGVVKGQKEYHVDLARSLVEMRESWDGEETARKTMRLPERPN